MDGTLNIQLFFFASAIAVALEAYKERERRIARLVLWLVVAVFGISGFTWPWLSTGLPRATASLSELSASPTAWFVVAVAIYFIARPFWAKRSDVVGPVTQIRAEPAAGELRRKLVNLEGRLALVEETLEPVSKRLNKIESAAEAIDDDIKLLDSNLNERVSDQSSQVDHLYNLLAELQNDNVYERNVLRMKLEAQGHVGFLAEKAAHVDAAGRELIDKVEKEGLGYWKTTKLLYDHPVEFWLELASKYDAGALQEATGCSQDEAAERAKDITDMPLTDSDKIQYASFLVKWERWPALRDRIAALVHDFAYRDKARQIVQREDDLDGTSLKKSF